MADLARRLAVARGDEPADLVVRGGRVLSVFTREWLETDVAIADGFVAGLGDYEGRETLDASGRWVVPGFVDAHMHLESSKLLVDEFARLVLPARDDRGRRRPARDRERARHRRRPLAARRVRRGAARRLLHGVVVRARVAVRVAAARAHAGRPRRAAAPAARDRARRDDELPRRRSRATSASSRSSGSTARRTSTATRRACSASS